MPCSCALSPRNGHRSGTGYNRIGTVRSSFIPTKSIKKMIRTSFLTTILVAGALAAGVLSSPVHAQAFTAGVDKPIPRYCTNACVQSNEQMVVDVTSGDATAMWNEPWQDPHNAYGADHHALIGAHFNASTNTWSAPTALRITYRVVPTGKLMGDTLGNAMMVLPIAQTDPNYASGAIWYDLVAVKWVNGNGWYQDTIRTESSFAPDSPVVASMGRSGHVFVSYSVRNYTTQSSQARLAYYSLNARSWTTANAAAGSHFDHIVADPHGGAVAISHRNGQVITKRFDTATRSWASSATLEVAGYMRVAQFNAASDHPGNVMVIYERVDNAGVRTIKTARYQRDIQRWTVKTLPKISSSQLYGPPSIATDRYNNFYTTFIQYSGGYMKTIAARYSGSGGTWATPVVISRGTYHARDASVTTDYAGNAIVVWSQRTDTGTGSSTGKIFRTTAVRYTNAVWGTPMIIQDSTRNSYRPYLGADRYGRTVVMWTQDSSITGVKEIRADRLIPR